MARIQARGTLQVQPLESPPHFWDRVQGENDEVCEQVFSWMSRYSRTMNKLRPIRPCLRSCRCAITAGWLHTVASHL